MMFVACLVFAAIMAGCGNQALKANASVARAMLEVQVTSSPIIRDLRSEAGTKAGRAVFDAGGEEPEALTAASEELEGWQCAVDGHRIYSSAVGAYISALALWSAGERFELADALPFLTRALAAYRSLWSCLKSHDVDALPEVPGFLSIIPITWGVES